MEQHIICPNCGATAATLSTTPAVIPSQSEPRVEYHDELASFVRDELASFVQARCRLRTDGAITVAELRSAYESWAVETGAAPVSAKRFGMGIAQLPGVERWRTKDTRMFMGIALTA